jgi:hypothetical protein
MAVLVNSCGSYTLLGTLPKTAQDLHNFPLQNYLQNAIFVVGSQPTYEDLKLGYEVIEAGPELGSQPTYEDLMRHIGVVTGVKPL